MDVQKPKVLETPLDIPNKLLMGPGPSNSSPRVLKALSQPVLGHMHAECFKIMDDIKEGIRYVFQTKNALTLAISASGHSGMEAVMCNLIEPGDTVLIAASGIWGLRASDMAKRHGAIVKSIKSPLDNNFTLVHLENAIKDMKPKLLFIVQGESSTGVYQPLEGLGDICKKYDCLLAVDTVASLGGVPIFADRWGIDAIYTGSQKVLGAPPGVTPISFSLKAQKKIFNRKTPISVYYLDMTLLGQQWNCFDSPRIYHHTVSSNLLAGLREALAIVAEEGLEEVIKRHRNCAERLYQGLERMGFKLFIEEKYKRLPTVTTVHVPKDVNWKDIVSYAMKNYRVEISGGLGPTADKVLRIGLMGINAQPENVDLVLKVLKEALDVCKQIKQSKL